MAEIVRDVRLTAVVDTNKATYTATFDDVDELRAWLRDLDLGLIVDDEDDDA